MSVSSVQKLYNTLAGSAGPASVLHRWLMLLLGFALVWAFMFIVAPWIEESPAVKPLAQFIQDTGIDASALYYTEIDETAEAEMYFYDAANYSPVTIPFPER